MAVQIAAEAHEQLTTLVARGGGLQDICDMVSSMLDGHVSVIDEAEQCIYASIADEPEPGIEAKASGTEREQELLYKRQDKIHAALVESRIIGRSVAAYAKPVEVCRVSAVVGSRGLLGGLIIRTATELNEVAVRIFERSSMVSGVVLLAQERNEYAARQEIPAIFRGLLSQPQHDLARLSEQAARHGLNLSQPLCVGIVQVKEDRAAYVLSKLRGISQLPATLFDEIDGTIVLISGAAADEDLRKNLERVIVQGMREPATGVISRRLAHASALPDCYQAMLRCMAALRALGRSGSIFLERELALYAFLFDKRAPEDIEAFLAATLGKLYQEGRQRKAELARTLLSYRDHGYNARAAATQLGIHINTFRQRLDVIDSLLGKWNDGSRALEIHVALRLLRLREEFASASDSLQ